MSLAPDVIRQLPLGLISDPFQVLGLHEVGGRMWLRVWLPRACAVVVHPLEGDEEPFTLTPREVPGYFEGQAFDHRSHFRYELEVTWPEGTRRQRDPYSFWLQLSDWDLARFAEGRHHHIEQILGAQVLSVDGVSGARFSVWAPNAQRVAVVGDWNQWDESAQPMRRRHPYGVWEIFVPSVGAGARYKFAILAADGQRVLKADPYARGAELPPATASIVCASAQHTWADQAWMERRDQQAGTWAKQPLAIYECHIGSWDHGPDGQRLSYLELGKRLAAHCQRFGFTHIQFLPLAQHPYEGSWGYQVSGYFAPNSRHGSADDLRAMIDYLHQHNLGVLVDFVPAHFPKDIWALSNFDGTPCYEYGDPREGEHKDWDTRIFNWRRPEVRNLLIGSALFWLRSFHVDGLRVDAVSSMLYRNYSRKEGEWVANEQGGNANQEAVSLLQELNYLVHLLFPGALTVAEESTDWKGVTAPTHWEGLGFDLKWNMGWMHDTLSYLALDPVLRSGSHDRITFHQWYAYDERWILPLSHDEVVHGKKSLLDKMWGDYDQRRAQLRLLMGYQATVPGRPLLFQGAEFAQGSEWNWQSALPWHEAAEIERGGVQTWLAEVLRVYRAEPALYQRDDQRQGFSWVMVEDRAHSVVAFCRHAEQAPDVLVVLNFTPVARLGYRLPVSLAGQWTLLLDSDEQRFSGWGGQPMAKSTPTEGHHGRPTLVVDLAPLSIRVWRAPS